MTPKEIIDRAAHSHVAHAIIEEFGHDGLEALDENSPLIETTITHAARVLLAHHPLAAVAITAAVHAAADAIAKHEAGAPEPEHVPGMGSHSPGR